MVTKEKVARKEGSLTSIEEKDARILEQHLTVGVESQLQTRHSMCFDYKSHVSVLSVIMCACVVSFSHHFQSSG